MDYEQKWEFEYLTTFIPVLQKDVQNNQAWLQDIVKMLCKFKYQCGERLSEQPPRFQRQSMKGLYDESRAIIQSISNEISTNYEKMAEILSKMRIQQYQINTVFDSVIHDDIKAKYSLHHIDIEIRENDLGIRKLEHKVKDLELDNQDILKKKCAFQSLNWDKKCDQQMNQRKIELCTHQLNNKYKQKNRLIQQYNNQSANVIQKVRHNINCIDQYAHEIKNSKNNYLRQFSTFQRKTFTQFQPNVSAFRNYETSELLQLAQQKCQGYECPPPPHTQFEYILERVKQTESHEIMNKSEQ